MGEQGTEEAGTSSFTPAEINLIKKQIQRLSTSRKLGLAIDSVARNILDENFGKKELVLARRIMRIYLGSLSRAQDRLEQLSENVSVFLGKLDERILDSQA